MVEITNKRVSEIFNIDKTTITRWKRDPDKYPHRYELYKLGAMLVESEIEFSEVFALADKNAKLRNELESMLDHVKGLLK